jgi:hypothetical protein
MSAKNAVTNLFALPKGEIIFEDFSCSYLAGIKYMGKMYCCENYICFYASVMGIVKKVNSFLWEMNLMMISM